MYMEFLCLRWQTWFRMSSIVRKKSRWGGLEWKCTFHQWPPTELHAFIVLKFKWTHSFYFLKCWEYLTLAWTCYLLWSLYIVKTKNKRKKTFRPWTILGRNCDEKQIYTQFHTHGLYQASSVMNLFNFAYPPTLKKSSASFCHRKRIAIKLIM